MTAIATKHVDDIKIGGVPKIVRGQIIPALEAVFGKLTTHEEEFTNTGVRHKRHSNGTVEIDQDEYIMALKPIAHIKLIGAAPESDADEALVPLYWSLLGALAYSLLTQFWLAVYVVSLQRNTKKPW